MNYVAAAGQVPMLVNRYGGPVGVLGRLIGLGQEDTEDGLPWWSWVGVGVVIGGVATYAITNKFKR